jgi:hypothetical protein
MTLLAQRVILQACGLNNWLAGNLEQCLFSPIIGLSSSGVFGLLIGGSIFASLYFAGGGSLTTPTVVSILLGGVLIPVLPSQFAGIAWAILFLGGVAAALQVGQKYLLEPSTA